MVERDVHFLNDILDLENLPHSIIQYLENESKSQEKYMNQW